LPPERAHELCELAVAEQRPLRFSLAHWWLGIGSADPFIGFVVHRACTTERAIVPSASELLCPCQADAEPKLLDFSGRALATTLAFAVGPLENPVPLCLSTGDLRSEP